MLHLDAAKRRLVGRDAARRKGIWNADVIEKQLAHFDAGAVRRADIRGEYNQAGVRLLCQPSS